MLDELQIRKDVIGEAMAAKNDVDGGIVETEIEDASHAGGDTPLRLDRQKCQNAFSISRHDFETVFFVWGRRNGDSHPHFRKFVSQLAIDSYGLAIIGPANARQSPGARGLFQFPVRAAVPERLSL